MLIKFRRSQGFTVLELLVVIAIIGILSAVVLMSVNSARMKAKDARVISDVKSMRTLAELGYNGSSYADICPDDRQPHTNGATMATAFNWNWCVGPNSQAMQYLADDISKQGGGYAILGIKTKATDPYNAVSYAIFGHLVSSSKYFCLDSLGGSSAATSTYTSDICGK